MTSSREPLFDSFEELAKEASKQPTLFSSLSFEKNLSSVESLLKLVRLSNSGKNFYDILCCVLLVAVDAVVAWRGLRKTRSLVDLAFSRRHSFPC